MNFHIISLFPDLVASYLNESILARAIEQKKIKVAFYNPRDFVKPTKTQKSKPKPYLRVDDKPYGGGPGMVLEAEPVLKAVKQARSKIKTKTPKIKTIFFAPGGKKFNTMYAKQAVKKYTDIILICGRYEGIDSRVKKILRAEELSVGDFVLTGGEIPAMILIDSIARQVRGVLGNFDSREEERSASDEVYTRPEVLLWEGKNYKVPKVLLSGNHKEIEKWRGEKTNKKFAN